MLSKPSPSPRWWRVSLRSSTDGARWARLVAAVADLVLFDAENPRSLVYQLERLRSDLKALPGSSGSSRPERLVDEIATGCAGSTRPTWKLSPPTDACGARRPARRHAQRPARPVGRHHRDPSVAAGWHATAVGSRRAPGGAVTHGPTGTAAGRCYQITHRTVYRYSDVVTSSYGRGFLTPRDSVRQRCLSHELVIEPGAADSSTSRDAYGNLSSYFHVTERHQTLTITSNSVVEVDPVPPSCTAAGRRWRPWEIARPVGLDGALATEFVLDLQPPEITDEVRAYAAPSFAPGRPLIEVLAETSSPASTPTSPTGPGRRRCPLGSTRFWRPGKGYVRTSRGSRSPACAPTGWPPVTFRGIWSPTRPREGAHVRHRRDPRLGIGVDAAESVAGLGSDQRPNGRRALHRRRIRPRLRRRTAAAGHHLHRTRRAA